MLTTINPATSLANWCRRCTGMMQNDLKAITDEQYSTAFGGVARPPHDFVAEVAGFNMMLASMIKGTFQGPPDDAARDAFKATLSSRTAGIEAIGHSGNALAEAIENGGDKLAEEVEAPWGEKLSLYEFANIAANHILYHDGQLNYVQSLNGDGEMHWFDN